MLASEDTLNGTMKVRAVHRFDQPTSGFWGQHRSSIDWCEVNTHDLGLLFTFQFQFDFMASLAL